ncbi:hypothetical protein, partial [Klebsiella pneumoniae]|uniref:hypothetical protein n=1 Tax=Klebsiella pneumoniae TaxID=573 RepID=UPI0038600A2A
LIAAFIHDLERLAGLLDGGVSEAVYAEVVGHGEVWCPRRMGAGVNHRGFVAPRRGPPPVQRAAPPPPPP